jgi:UDP-N-acetylmuramoylalanine--D-glutamate ligase
MTNYIEKAKKLYSGKKVLILGLGVNQGGVGAAKFFSLSGCDVKVTDLKDENLLKNSLDELKKFPEITYTLGVHKKEDIDWADIVLRNPAIKPSNEFLKYAENKNKTILMDLNVFFEFVSPKQVIGVTGTKGKSTTASLIYEVLSSCHSERSEESLDVILAGNIGKSVFDVLPLIQNTSYLILELSSFQLQALESLKVSPHISVITNIFPDHLNYHSSMEEYAGIKKLIAKFQTPEDIVLLNKDDEVLNSADFHKDLKGKVIGFSKADIPDTFHPLLPGEHNKENFAAALSVARIFDIEILEALEKMEGFTGVEFRLQLIKELNGIKIYNDSAATNPGATIEALKSLPNSVLICGGMNKELFYLELAETIDQYAKRVYFIEGDATEEIKISMHETDKIMGTYNNLQELLTDVLEEAEEGDTILFSPGATSFNLFQNEFDRGRKFNAALEKVLAN